MGQPDEVTDALQIGRVVRDTQQTVRGTSDRVEELRREVGVRIDQLDAKVDDVALTSARVEGAVGVLTDELRQERHTRSQIRVSAVQASLEVEKTGEIARINEAVAVRADRRRRAIKYAAIVGPIIAAALGLLAGRC